MLWVIDLAHLATTYHFAPGDTLEQLKRWFDRIFIEYAPTGVVFTSDAEHTFRHSLYPEYKAGRKEKTIELLKDLADAELWAAKWHIERHRHFEADDIMASYAKQANMPVVLVTNDKDLRQCLTNGKVGMFHKRKDENGQRQWMFFSQQDAENEWGVPKQLFVDFQMLVGDDADNIKGLKGVGPVNAAKLLHKWGKAENIPTGNSNFAEWMHRAPMLRKLLTLNDSLEVDCASPRQI